MALILHGFVWAESRAPLPAAPHRRTQIGRLVALSSEQAPTKAQDPDEQTALAAAFSHHKLLSAYCAEHDVLPVRFGSAFSSEGALIERVTATRGSVTAALENLADRLEFVLRVEDAKASAQSDLAQVTSGRAFLANKRDVRDAQRKRGADRKAFIERLAGAFAEVFSETLHLDPRKPAIAALAVLVDRYMQAEFWEWAQRLSNEAEALGLKIAATGPGPAYSFVDMLDAQMESRVG